MYMEGVFIYYLSTPGWLLYHAELSNIRHLVMWVPLLDSRGHAFDAWDGVFVRGFIPEGSPGAAVCIDEDAREAQDAEEGGLFHAFPAEPGEAF